MVAARLQMSPGTTSYTASCSITVRPLEHYMESKAITPASHNEMTRKYPITGLVEGWYFRQREISASCYVVEGSDVYGRTISRQATGDPDTAMAECVAFARSCLQGHRIK